jgi:DNA polymerase-3 subunit chi
MSQISFYHLKSENTSKSICQLLEKCYTSGLSTLVRTSTTDIQESINNTLWTFAQKSFIPHGSPLDPNPDLQPIYITTGSENPNKATALMLVGTLDGIYDGFERVFVMLSDWDNSFIDAARVAYHKLNTSNNTLKYYVQNDKSGWQEGGL